MTCDKKSTTKSAVYTFWVQGKFAAFGEPYHINERNIRPQFVVFS